jgi:outer membrane protein
MKKPSPLSALVPALLVMAFVPPPSLSAQEEATPPPTLVEPYEVGTAQPPMEEGREMVTLTLEEAIDRALEHNLDVRSARLDPEIQRYALEGARAAFNPSFQSSLGYNNATRQSTSQLDGGTRITTERNTLNLGLVQPLPWYGAEVSATFDSDRTSTDNIFATRNPSYYSAFSLNLVQPLLSGRRIDGRRNVLRTEEVRRGVVDARLRDRIDALGAEVRTAYWNLRALIEEIEIQRRSLAQAEQLLENNRIMVEQGIMVEIDLAQAEAQVAAAEQALLNAEVQWRNHELAFKRLLVGGTDDPFFHRTINPVDLPEYDQVEVDVETAIETAVRTRPDLQALRQEREITEMDLEVTRDNTRPNLDLVLSYSLQGVGGDLFERAELGGEPQLIERGGYMDGLSSIASFDTPTLNAMLQFSYPLGSSQADANLEQARLRNRQARLNLESQLLLVETEVTNAGLAVTSAYQQLEAARRSREAAERSAEAEMTRFTVGVSTNFQVVAAQDALTRARLSELRATIDYINAVADFERVQGRALEL